LVLAPGCKGGEMAAKRWPHFAALAGHFADVAVVGTEDDLRGFGGAPRPPFPPHVRNLVGRLTLRQTAASLAAAGAVVANDSGIGHMAAAVGVPTVLLFGPTPAATLGRFPPNVTVLDAGLPCAPCWFGARFSACGRRIDCLQGLTVSRVIETVHALGFVGEEGSISFLKKRNKKLLFSG
jgi:ADP-heptose:LPS heptosyltransferase